jgi:hypothetical protein
METELAEIKVESSKQEKQNPTELGPDGCLISFSGGGIR